MPAHKSHGSGRTVELISRKALCLFTRPVTGKASLGKEKLWHAPGPKQKVWKEVVNYIGKMIK